MSNDPRWFWMATFVRGATATFYADGKDEARDHAATLARDFGRWPVVKVTRLKHAKDVTPEENAAAGTLHEPDPTHVAFAEELKRAARRARGW